MLGPLFAGDVASFTRLEDIMKLDEIPDARRDLRAQISKIVDDRGSIKLEDITDMNEVISVIKGVMSERKSVTEFQRINEPS